MASWKAEFTAEAPRHFGRALRGDLSGLSRYRVGDFRLIAKLEDAILTVVIIKTGHRSAIYED